VSGTYWRTDRHPVPMAPAPSPQVREHRHSKMRQFLVADFGGGEDRHEGTVFVGVNSSHSPPY